MSDPHKAALNMAKIIYADLDIDVQPHEITALIRKRWDRIAPLAHIIHDAPDVTKAPPVTPDAQKPVGAKERAANELRMIINGMQFNNMDGQAQRLLKVVNILEGVE